VPGALVPGYLGRTAQFQVDQLFSPTSHYRNLIRERELLPLSVEEHTAEISNQRRLEIERLFKRDDDESIDIISGSTTFELGIDLGTIGSVFLMNLPPRVSNYRQRAGRAGRREGITPFVLSYVRQRPHDQYFWRNLTDFISGPVSTPKFKLSSEVVLTRHGFSVLLSHILREYERLGGIKGDLWGPTWDNICRFVLDPVNRARISKPANDVNGETATSLRFIYDGISEPLRGKLTGSYLLERFMNRIRFLDPLLRPRGDEGCIKLLGDLGILPTYSFPIYVDELRLNKVAPQTSPRCDLKLTRDRRISIVEYHPGRTIVAGKTHICSNGIWDGYEIKNFKRCSACGEIIFNQAVGNTCPRCNAALVALTAVIPWGGYYGAQSDAELPPPEIDYEEILSSEVLFDPANDPPADFRLVGTTLQVATVDANLMRAARMRQFSPRPGSKAQLLLEQTRETDQGVPRTTFNCLSIPKSNAISNSTLRSYYLLHEFTTDMVRLRILPTQAGQGILANPKLLRFQQDSSLSEYKKRWYLESLWRTFGEVLLIASARFLDIDEVHNPELGIAFKTEPLETCTGGREIILYDTAPGGAGYLPACFAASAAWNFLAGTPAAARWPHVIFGPRSPYTRTNCSVVGRPASLNSRSPSERFWLTTLLGSG